MIRVLIVDDSLVMRKLLGEMLASHPGIDVVGTAADPYIAREKLVQLKPEVMTLDIEMPKMDGLTFLGKVMKYYPLPVVIVSSLTPWGSALAVKALEMGAVEIVGKPDSDTAREEFFQLIIDKIHTAALAHIHPPAYNPPRPDGGLPATELGKTDQILAIGASTGGPDALKQLFLALPATTPGTVIVQHMPEFILPAFAARLNEISALEIRVANGEEKLRPGLVLIAPGRRHLLISKRGDHYITLVKDGVLVCHQKPSVEVLFHSVAKHAGPKAVGVLLTGMGTDGAAGLLAMKKAGAFTLAQDEASSVVYGMPRAAAEIGAAEKIVSLEKIPEWIVSAFQKGWVRAYGD